jgi:hypothetical protein
MCVGATFNLVGVVTEWSPDSIYRIETMVAADITALNTDACGGGGEPPAVGDLVINEFLADPPPDAAGDANCDGERDSGDDEFVELVNVTDHDLDLAGVIICDDDGGTPRSRFTFPVGTTLGAGQAAVVFGGGSADCDFPEMALVFVSGTNFGYNNGGDIVTVLASDSTTVLDQYAYPGDGPSGEADQSLNLNPDVTGTAYALHGNVPGAVGVYSPGRRVDGSPF